MMLSTNIAKKLTVSTVLIAVLIGGVGFFVISVLEKEKSISQVQRQALVLGNSIHGAVRRAMIASEIQQTTLQRVVNEMAGLNRVKDIEVLDSELNVIAHKRANTTGEPLSGYIPLVIEAQRTGKTAELLVADGFIRIDPVFWERKDGPHLIEAQGHSSHGTIGFIKILFDKEMARSPALVEGTVGAIRTTLKNSIHNSVEDTDAFQILIDDFSKWEEIKHIEVFSSDLTIIGHSDERLVGSKVGEDLPGVSKVFETGRAIDEVELENQRIERYLPITLGPDPRERPYAVLEIAFSMEETLTAFRAFQAKVLGMSAGLAVILLGLLGFVVQRVISDREKAEEKLDYMIHHDKLTGLAKRSLLVDRLDQALIRSPWIDRVVAVISLNIVQFKRINESLGHHVGDLLLQAISKRLSACIRGGDSLARMGADHFMVVLSDMGSSGDEGRIAQNMIDALSRPFNIRGHELFIQACLGISTFPQDGEDSETLLTNAEAAMGRSRETGEHSFQYYSPEMSEKISQRLFLETSLQKALQNGELYLNYQPIVEIATGSIKGFEALIRWNHPEKGIIPPMDFIPLAEESGQIYAIGEWVMRTACAQTRVWQEKGNSDLHISVNLSGRQFQQKNLLNMVKGILNETGLKADHLVLELTESILMKDAGEAIKILEEFNRMKIDISIDDFGTGYSSLSYLKRFPIQTLKIDRSFIRDVMSNPDDATIVKTIITMAHSMRLKVVAEGVETKEQYELLRDLGCDTAQGYLLSRPMSAILATDMLLESGKSAI